VAVSLNFETPISPIRGLVFLRLICPCIIFPQKYKLVDQITSGGQKTLIVVAKILQKIANGGEEFQGPMRCVNRLIKQNASAWKAFFHELVTGEELRIAVTSEITVDDLLGKSNQNLSKVIQSKQKPILQKQEEVITLLFRLEKQLDGWKVEKRKQYDIFHQQFKQNSNIRIVKCTSEIKGSVEQIFKFLNENYWTKELNSSISKIDLVEELNENLSILHSYYDFFLLDSRDCVFIKYKEFLEEDNFAIIAIISTDRSDIPVMKGYIRADVVGGWIIRGSNLPNRSKTTLVLHSDAKGNLTKMPKFLIKKALFNFTDSMKVMMDVFEKKSLE